MKKSEILFIFTKHFPFGTAEQYLVDEVPYLLKKFDKIIFVPCEKFDSDEKNKRTIPTGCEVLFLNVEAQNIKSVKKRSEFLSVFIGEWFACRNKSWFWKERKRYSSVLLHQQHLASVFENILKERFPDCAPVFYAYWIHNSSIMLSLMKRRGVIKDFIARGHSIDLYEWDWALTRYIKILPFYHFIIRRASKIAAISQHGATYLTKRFPEVKDRFIVARLGVSDSGINPFQKDSVFTIVSCSNFSENKRVDVIAECISKLKLPVRWVHFGDGPGREKVETVIKDLPPNCTVELKGFTPNPELKKFYSSASVNLFVNLSEAEGIPVSLMEAISFGIPVLATNVYGNPEIANEQTGFSVPFSSDSSELADIIEKFAGNTENQLSIRSSARAFYLRNFTDSDNYTSFALELRKLL